MHYFLMIIQHNKLTFGFIQCIEDQYTTAQRICRYRKCCELCFTFYYDLHLGHHKHVASRMRDEFVSLYSKAQYRCRRHELHKLEKQDVRTDYV